MRNYFLLYTTLLLIVFSGCGEQPVYSSSVSVSDPWLYDQPMTYTIDIEDNTAQYDLLYDLDYSTDFGFQNLYVNIATAFPNGKTTEDILSLNLTDGAGTFLGDCSSSNCSVEILLQENFKFESVGTHTIKVFQNGREEKLNGIYGATLKLFKRKTAKK